MNLKGKFLAASIVVALVALRTVAMAADTTVAVTKEGAAVTAIQSGADSGIAALVVLALMMLAAGSVLVTRTKR